MYPTTPRLEVSTTQRTSPSTPAGPQCTSGWGSWVNNNSPSTPGATGDSEHLTPAELAAFCPNGKVTEVDCIDADTGDSWDSLADSSCDVVDGLICENIPFDGVPPCHDYKIRYLCNCAGGSPPATSGPPSIPPIGMLF